MQVGGTLASRKGISLPDTVLPVGPLTDKDKADLDFALRLGVDWVALSFVQRGEDVKLARQIIGQAAAIMSKIEKPAAIADLDSVIAQSDGLMVARGDLGVEMPVERVPVLQKQITGKARAAGKPVVVATQMLESMISSPVPTRAEVSDVATAVFDGADAIMLSAESAVGKYPVEAIRTMDRIAIEVESDPSYGAIVHATRTPPLATAADAIAAAAHTVADTVKLAGIICYTATGSTALRVARERPGLPVIGLSPVVATGRRLAMAWGVHCVLTSDPENQAAMVRKACRIAFDEGFAKAGEGVIIVAGVPLGSPGTTNMIRIAYLDDAGNPVARRRLTGLRHRFLPVISSRGACAEAIGTRGKSIEVPTLEMRRASNASSRDDGDGLLPVAAQHGDLAVLLTRGAGGGNAGRQRVGLRRLHAGRDGPAHAGRARLQGRAQWPRTRRGRS